MHFLQYHQQFEDKIYSYFYYNLNQNISQAEDLTSETFLKAFKSFSSFEQERDFSSWIFRIAKNTLYDYYRKQKQDIGIEEVSQHQIQEFLSYEHDIWKNIDNQEKIEDFYQALERLKPAEKEIIIYKYLQDFSPQEISEKTGKSQVNIRKILSRWLKKVREMMK